MRYYKTPLLFEKIFNHCTWHRPTDEKVIYLTFDDGPIPRLTEYILDVLNDYSAKATFFCVGDNMNKHRSIAKIVIEQGHAIGNHTFHHLKAWKTEMPIYLNDINMFEDEFFRNFGREFYSWLFRPPYGQLKPGLARKIQAMGYEVIMWDILSYDFDRKVNPADALAVLKRKSKSGSIVVFHDNYKAEENLRHILPGFLSHFSEQGYIFNLLKNEKIEK